MRARAMSTTIGNYVVETTEIPEEERDRFSSNRFKTIAHRVDPESGETKKTIFNRYHTFEQASGIHYRIVDRYTKITREESEVAERVDQKKQFEAPLQESIVRLEELSRSEVIMQRWRNKEDRRDYLRAIEKQIEIIRQLVGDFEHA